MTVVFILLGIAAHLWALACAGASGLAQTADGKGPAKLMGRALLFACLGMILIGVAQ